MMASREGFWSRVCVSGSMVALALAGCGVPPSAEARSAASESAGVGSSRPVDASATGTTSARLAMTLRALPLPGGVLEGLPPNVMAALKAATAKLTPGARDELRADAELAERHPMLHVFEGGREPVAWCRLAADSRIVFGWFQAARAALRASESESEPKTAAGIPLPEQVEGTAQVMSRAAAYCLRDFALELKSRGSLSSERLEVLALVSRIHTEPATTALVFELVVEIEPSAETWTNVALWRARKLDATGARAALEIAGRGLSEGPPPWATATVQDSVAAATELSRDGVAPLARARALLRLGRATEARSEVREAGLSPGQHLAAAGVFVRAAISEAPCSKLDEGAWSSPFCRAFWRSDSTLRGALETLDEAWAKGGGRDAAAVETYLAVAHVLRESVTASQPGGPATPGGAGAEAEAEAEQRNLARAARAAAALSPRLAAIAFYATVREAIERRSTLGSVQAIASSFGVSADASAPALKLVQSDAFVQAAWLNIAMAYGASDDVAEVLANVPEVPHRDFIAVAAALRLRNAALHRREDYPEVAARSIKSIASADDPGLVLLLAETEAVETPDALARLLRLARRLAEPGNGAALRTRAALDAAVAHMAEGRWADVETTLAPFESADPKARFLWVLARFADGKEASAPLNAALVPLASAANPASVDWRRWIIAAKKHRSGVSRDGTGAEISARQSRIADMSRWASGYRVTADARLEPELVFMPHLWPVP